MTNDPLGQVLPLVDEAGGPLGIVGRSFGLGAAEMEAGVPWWGWLGVGVVAGAVGCYFLKDKIEAFVER